MFARRTPCFPLACLILTCGLVTTAPGQRPQLVAPTDALSPEEQRETFHLPPGFEIQLVVSEPLIGQPMNLQFDAAGRLWITSSVEYPYPVEGEGVQPRDARFGPLGEPPAKDRLTVVAGIGPDGKPETTWHFAEGLNIPIGHTPVPGGAIVFDIPAISLHRDTNGDGKADEKRRLYGTFGNVDTHGLNNGFTRWIDGWVYACHGFRNTSHVKSPDGHEFTMNSGNTYRFRADGSRIEQFTWGQVNPFGLTFDPWGNAYTADCHSKPLTMLLRGAYYSSFGKPHDGLGFGPDMIRHDHGSTGICGPAYYAAEHFPPDYRDNLFLCNPVTGRVHRDKLVDHGSTRIVDTQPDFVTSDDPWFRPVDVQAGPDGALYVADFYNAVIGHYEVPLKHPKRDRTHGRVWRIVYRGEDGSQPAPKLPDLTGLSLEELFAELANGNLVVRRLATNAIVDRFPEEAPAAARELLSSESTPEQRAHALWIVHRLGEPGRTLTERLANDASPLVRTHLVRSLAERSAWNDATADLARGMLTDANAFVRRAAADAVGRHPAIENVGPLLGLLRIVPAEDTHLRHTVRIALRNHLREDAITQAVRKTNLDEQDWRELASVTLAVPTRPGTELLADYLERSEAERGAFPDALRHVARYGTEATLARLATAVRERFGEDPQFQYRLLTAVQEGLQQRGQRSSPAVEPWAAELALELFRQKDERIVWTALPVPGTQEAKDAWGTQTRRCADGRTVLLFSTLPRGERSTGMLQSEPFELPEKVSFYVAGHCGPPNQPCHGRNVVRLRDAKTQAVLAEAAAPRNDTAQRVEWDLSGHAGRTGFLELVDGDSGNAYAWLAVGRFSVAGLDPRNDAGLDEAVELVTRFELRSLVPDLEELLSKTKGGRQAAVAQALAGLRGDGRLKALVDVASETSVPGTLRERVFGLVTEPREEGLGEVLKLAMQAVPQSRQRAFAETLAGDRPGGAALLSLVEAGHASPRLLQRPTVRQRLEALPLEGVRARIAKLTAKLPAEDDRIAERMADWRDTFSPAKASVERGAKVYEKHCAACHRIGEKGSLIGPQLDGIGIRGVERILEDVLDPNRNVDGAFRTTTLVLSDGKVKSGLLRREEGATLVLADQKGKEFRVAKGDVEERVSSPLSLMPANFHEVLKEEDAHDLLAYLLEQRQPRAVDAADGPEKPPGQKR